MWVAFQLKHLVSKHLGLATDRRLRELEKAISKINNNIIYLPEVRRKGNLLSGKKNCNSFYSCGKALFPRQLPTGHGYRAVRRIHSWRGFYFFFKKHLPNILFSRSEVYLYPNPWQEGGEDKGG